MASSSGQMTFMSNPAKNNGFTLIELVMTIIILGILASVALPKFVNLRKEANIAKVNTMVGSLNTAALEWHAYAKVKGCTGGSSSVTKPDGTTLNLLACYPEAGGSMSNTNGTEIDSVVTSDGYTIRIDGDEHTFFNVPEASDPTTCRADYRQGEDRGGVLRSAVAVAITSGC